MQLKGVTKKYRHPVVDHVDLEVSKRRLTSFIGPNGAGKSTLLGMMSRLLPKDEGFIFINGQEVEAWNSTELAKELAVLKQNQQVHVSMTVEEFVRFGRFPYTKGKITKSDEQIVEGALENTNLLDFRNQDIGTLSGGQYQRALIAMVLAQDTEWILLDEPLNHLDMKQAYEVMNLLRFLVDEKGKSIVIVMHDLNMASNFSDEIACFKNGKCIIHDTVDEVMKEEILSDLYEIPLEVTEIRGKKICIIKNGEFE